MRMERNLPACDHRLISDAVLYTLLLNSVLHVSTKVIHSVHNEAIQQT